MVRGKRECSSYIYQIQKLRHREQDQKAPELMGEARREGAEPRPHVAGMLGVPAARALDLGRSACLCRLTGGLVAPCRGGCHVMVKEVPSASLGYVKCRFTDSVTKSALEGGES